MNVPAGTEIPPGTTEQTAKTFPYSYTGAPLSGTIRNNVSITILNHSSRPGTAFGPNPKVTYSGTIPPPSCVVTRACTTPICPGTHRTANNGLLPENVARHATGPPLARAR